MLITPSIRKLKSGVSIYTVVISIFQYLPLIEDLNLKYLVFSYFQFRRQARNTLIQASSGCKKLYSWFILAIRIYQTITPTSLSICICSTKFSLVTPLTGTRNMALTPVSIIIKFDPSIYLSHIFVQSSKTGTEDLFHSRSSPYSPAVARNFTLGSFLLLKFKNKFHARYDSVHRRQSKRQSRTSHGGTLSDRCVQLGAKETRTFFPPIIGVAVLVPWCKYREIERVVKRALFVRLCGSRALNVRGKFPTVVRSKYHER